MKLKMNLKQRIRVLSCLWENEYSSFPAAISDEGRLSLEEICTSLGICDENLYDIVLSEKQYLAVKEGRIRVSSELSSRIEELKNLKKRRCRETWFFWLKVTAAVIAIASGILVFWKFFYIASATAAIV